MVIATFLLGGWDSPIYLGDEQKRQRDPGRSVLISITFCTLWVIFLFICLQGLASSSAIKANASNVLPFLAGRIGPKGFADLVALAVIASFGTTIQSQIVDGSRIMFGMGRDRTLPKALGRVNPRFRTPVAGLIVMGVIPVLALILYLASGSLQKTIIYIDSTGGLLFAGYYVVISLYSIWYYRTVLFRDLREFLLGLLLPLVGAATLVYVIVKSLPGTPVPVRIIAVVLFLVGIPLAFLSKAITRAPFFRTRRESGLSRLVSDTAGLRSDGWLGGDDEVALNHRAALGPALGPVLGPALGAAGLRRSGGRSSGRPLIGIACTASDLNRCDRGLTTLALAVRRGVLAAGGLPLEFPVMLLSEDLMKPTAMLYRNLLAIEVEETIRSQPLDGIVALGNCDKTVPAYLMALASADIPGLVVTGGFRVPALFDGSRLGSGIALWRLYDSRRGGALDDAAWARLESCLGQGLGACNTMGTASTMAIMAETLGLALPGVGRAGLRGQRPAGLAGAAPDARLAGARGMRLRLPAG